MEAQLARAPRQKDADGAANVRALDMHWILLRGVIEYYS